MMSLKYQYYIAQPTISQIIVETCNALWTYLMPRVLNELSCDDWLNVAQEFDIKCHFPHCLGAVDGKHVIVQVICKIFCKFFYVMLMLMKNIYVH